MTGKAIADRLRGSLWERECQLPNVEIIDDKLDRAALAFVDGKITARELSAVIGREARELANYVNARTALRKARGDE